MVGRNKEEGAKNPINPVNVIYEWPQTVKEAEECLREYRN